MMEGILILLGTWSALTTVFSSTSASSIMSSSPSTPLSPPPVAQTTPGVANTTGRLQQLGTRGQWLLRHIASMTLSCGVKEMSNMKRKLLRHSEVTCNDGTPAGYYIRKSHGSQRWIVFLEGGWYCFDHVSCSERSRVMGDYMSSRNWPKFRSGSGIMSWDPLENPYYFHSNVVYIPYCSSDSWSGTRPRSSAMEFSFMGSRILDEVFTELLKKGLKQAKTVLVAGTSAGGTGVLINIDRIADIIHASDASIDVRGLVDAGWFLDNEPFRAKHCRDAFTCSPMAGIQKGAQVWVPRLPEACRAIYPNEIWRCFFGHRVFSSIKSSIYVIQNLYDAAQIKVNNVFDERPRSDLSSEQWRYLLSLGEEVKQSLQNVTAVFAPACVAHEVLTQPEWHAIRIQGISLAESIHCWESGAITSSCLQSNLESLLPKTDPPLSDAPPHSQGKRKKRKKGKKNKKKKEKKNKEAKKRYSRSVMKRCQRKLLDECPWPHCNCSCAKSRWETMTEVNSYFLKTLAAVMGIDPSKMANSRLCGS
ncbi:palmitoleoyl-protein carboxylesterase notum1a [Biomphalaria pfeifferi]|uniref:Palmitoleoyl-protein carboxylesterase notum1a n=1 Tax=Biomphalaria pfeifferi TaxID=112525 RepID=A0AAD8C138_BIOPF|nr:palmitoleoyl-protein carboxylesterase notum1a [Biomphalaria pfeifferi]